MAGLASSLSAVVLILCGAVNALLSKVGKLLQTASCTVQGDPRDILPDVSDGKG